MRRIKYSSETRKLRIYRPDFAEPSTWHRVGMIKLAQKVWFLEIWPDLEERSERLQAEPKSPCQVQEISYILRRLKKLQPVLVLDLPGWRNPRENPRAEWLLALREVDSLLAQKVKKFINGEGKREYLNSH